MKYDFGPEKEDERGPYIQSLRLNIYKKYYMQLIKSQKAYVCFIKNDELYPEYNVDKALNKMASHSYVVKLKVFLIIV